MNSSYYITSHAYKNAGTYFIKVIASDGTHEAQIGFLINITNIQPYAHIAGAANLTEDGLLYLEARIGDSPSDEQDLRYYWDFGDGSFSYELNPSHAWKEAGNYTIRLFVRDNNGAFYNTSEAITVFEKLPFIEGPFIFNALEGNVIILDVAVFDSWFDTMMGLDYRWELFGPNGEFIDVFTDKKPFLVLNDGNYSINFTVTDWYGQSVSENITVIVKNVVPTVIVASKIYYGNATSESVWDGSDPWVDLTKGIEIVAYTIDRPIDYGLLVYKMT